MGNTNAKVFVIGFIIYMIAMIAIGYLSSRGKTKGKNYLTGGASLPFFLIFGTMSATLIGTGSSIGATANGFKGGFFGSAYGLGAAIGIVVFVILVKKSDLRSFGFVTMAEEAQYHYNGNKHVKALMSIMIFVVEVIWLGNHINGGATYLGFVTGLDPIIAKLLTTLAFGLYVIIGGYLAVVWTDFFQLMILLLGFVTILVSAIPAAGGWASISEAYIAAGNEGALSAYGIESVGIMALISLMYSIAIPCLGTPTYRMRVYTAKDTKTAVKGLNLSALLLFVFSFIPALIGMAAFTLASNNNVTQVLENPNYAFTYIATVALGPVLGLVFMIAGLSATMSSADSDAIAGVTTIIQDIYPLVTGKEMPEEKVTVWSRIATVITLVLAFTATLYATDIIGYISNVIGSIIPGVSVAMLLGQVWKKASWQGCFASIISGLVFGVCFLMVPAFHEWIIGVFTGPAIPATIISLAAHVIVSLLTPFKSLSKEDRMEMVLESRGSMHTN